MTLGVLLKWSDDRENGTLGINTIVNKAQELSEGNKFVGILLQKEVDHLNRAGEVNKLLTDDTVGISIGFNSKQFLHFMVPNLWKILYF